MKTVLTFSFLLLISGSSLAQTNDEDLVRRAALNYIEGFYEGDTLKLQASLKPDLLKYGYMKDRRTGEYGDEIYMSFDQAKTFAQRVKRSGNFPSDNAPKKVEILDMMNHIAAVKITAWWGTDYMLLSKEGDKWMIGQVIWEGPLEK
ncbi:MAG: nuclear transport factor 2 family protein [Balneola sp.]